MKRVTKKLVLNALEVLAGWNFAYDFTESRSLVLFGNAKISDIVEHLEAKGVEVINCVPPCFPRNGSMKLQMKPK